MISFSVGSVGTNCGTSKRQQKVRQFVLHESIVRESWMLG